MEACDTATVLPDVDVLCAALAIVELTLLLAKVGKDHNIV
jgi:hypothetical protein